MRRITPPAGGSRITYHVNIIYMKQTKDAYKSGHENYNTLDTMRHSAAHLLAAAILELYPHTKFGIGPTTENGFYYDFEFDQKISEDDFGKIEAKMSELKGKHIPFIKSEISINEAIQDAEKAQQPYKKELLEGLQTENKTVSMYQTGAFSDLCKGPHVENTKEIGVFKLLSLAGAYWKGSEKNAMLTRIYGTCFETKQALDEWLKLQEDAKAKDHRKLGKELGLFVFADLVGKGLPLLTPKGATIRRELERFIVDAELKRGYLHVCTPALAKVDLYRTSGHYPYYKDTMYPPMTIDDEELILRPMTCPHHFMFYQSEPHSYKELPMRIAELADLYRYEKSGELTGLIRVRTFCLADAHIIATPAQAESEIISVLDLIDEVNNTFGMKKGIDYRYRLSLGDRTDTTKYYKDDAAWEQAEQVLRTVLEKTNKEYFYEAENEAAFYGPKIDVQVKNVTGHEETAFTVQYDFVMPKRFTLRYVDADGKEKEPIVIHRSSLGCFERTMAFLIEKFAGAFPLWLSPTQVKVLPIAERHLAYAEEVTKALKEANIRVELDDRNEKLGSKIRDAQLAKINYMLVIGDKEAEAKSVAIRARGGADLGTKSIAEFVTMVTQEIASKAL